MDTKLLIDDKEIPLNKFVEKMLSGTIVGALTSLRDIKDDWKKIKIEITR